MRLDEVRAFDLHRHVGDPESVTQHRPYLLQVPLHGGGVVDDQVAQLSTSTPDVIAQM